MKERLSRIGTGLSLQIYVNKKGVGRKNINFFLLSRGGEKPSHASPSEIFRKYGTMSRRI
jgi:hypothetical protein